MQSHACAGSHKNCSVGEPSARMLVLGIETSCDETAAALVTDTGLVVAETVHSQVASFVPYGGVVPELAARDHMASIRQVTSLTLQRADLTPSQVGGIAVTSRPGLLGSLLVGLQYAKGLALALDLPFVGVDHLVGHMLSVFVRRPDEASRSLPGLPFICLLVSGGHTALYRVSGDQSESIIELGGTRDDAVGEAYDKVGKLLGLPYPGGPEVDRRAGRGNAKQLLSVLPRPFANRASLEFSFSGLKSALARHVEAHPPRNEEQVNDLCAAFQEIAVRTLVDKTIRAAQTTGISQIVVGGGVAANSELRRQLLTAAAFRGLSVHFPPLASCTDNAAMIAYVGALRLVRGERDSLDLSPSTKTDLTRVTRKGGGKRGVPHGLGG